MATATTSIEIGNIKNLKPPSPQADEIEITNLASTAKEFLQGLTDFGTVECDINFYPNAVSGDTYGHQALITDQAAGTVREWLIGFSDGTTSPPTVSSSAFGAPTTTTRSWVKFSGFVKSIPLSGSTNDVVSGQLVIRVTGSPTWYYKT